MRAYASHSRPIFALLMIRDIYIYIDKTQCSIIIYLEHKMNVHYITVSVVNARSWIISVLYIRPMMCIM